MVSIFKKSLLPIISLGISNMCYASDPIMFNGEELVFEGKSHFLTFGIQESTAFISIDGNNITLKTSEIDESKVDTIFQETLDIITKGNNGLRNTGGDLVFAGGRTAGTLSIGESEILASKQISYNAGPIVAQKVFFKAGQSIGITTSSLNFDRVFFTTGSVITFYVPKEHRTGLDSITWQPSSKNRSERQYDMFLDGFLDFENKIAENFMCHHTGAISFNFLKEQ